SNYPILLSVDDWGKRFTLNAHVETPIDPGRICAYMNTALERLVEGLEKRPATEARNLDGLPASERQQLLMELSATNAEYPHEQCVHTLFEAQAARTPHAIAVVHDNCQLSYDELNSQANRLAHYLRALGVQPGARVAIRLERSIDLVLAELAILKCGAAYAPLDRNAPVERQSLIVEDSEASLALSVKDLGAAEIICAKQVEIDDLRLWEQASSNPEIALESEMAAYVIYTSGSTGQPKGVVIPHRAIVRLAFNRYASFGAG